MLGCCRDLAAAYAETIMRIATILISILGAVGCAIVARYMFFSESDPATMGLDVAAGWTVTILFLVTGVPAFVLAQKGFPPGGPLSESHFLSLKRS